MRRYTVEIVNEKEGITDATPVNTIITIVGFIWLAVSIMCANLYFTGCILGR
jgi:hypothetical protein